MKGSGTRATASPTSVTCYGALSGSPRSLRVARSWNCVMTDFPAPAWNGQHAELCRSQGKGIDCIIVKDFSRFAGIISRSATMWIRYSRSRHPLYSVNDGYDSKQYEGKNRRDGYLPFRNFMYENYSRDLFHQGPFRNALRMKKGGLSIMFPTVIKKPRVTSI